MMNPIANIEALSSSQLNFIAGRIEGVEHFFAHVRADVGAMARQVAKCRDAMDDLARIIVGYADSETLNLTAREQITNMADILCGVADLQQNLVDTLEVKIVGGLSASKNACHFAKSDLHSNSKAQAKELQKSNKLASVRASGADYRKLAMAETELQRAAIDLSRTQGAFEESMEYFEAKKLRDLRRVLLELSHAKLQHHARSVEMFTRAFQHLQDIQVDADLEEFRKALLVPPSAAASSSAAGLPGPTGLRSDLTPSLRDLNVGRRTSRVTSSPREVRRFVAGNENSPYNQRGRAGSLSHSQPGRYGEDNNVRPSRSRSQ